MSVSQAGLSREESRLFELDLLRFLAALSVVLYHWAFRGNAADGLTAMAYPEISAWAKYGYLGVELFFVISGFVILMSARSGSLRSFAISRFIRLYPAFWICCSVTFATLLWLGSDHPDLRPNLTQFLVNLTMFSGFVDVQSIDGAYWSLFVEMRFYLMVAVVLALGWMPRAERLLWLWLALSVLVVVTQRGRLATWINAPHAALFIGGAVLFLIHESGWSRSRALLLGLSCCMAVWQQLQRLVEHSKHYATQFSPWIVGSVVVMIFVLLTLVATGKMTPFRLKAWMPLGATTYPLYLLHQNLGYVVFDQLLSSVNRHVLFWAALGSIALLAYATHRWFERPIAAYLRRLFEPITKF